VVKGSGNIGIGTTTPAANLEISNSGLNTALRLSNTNGTDANWELVAGDSVGGANSFRIWGGAAGGENSRLTIDQDGNIGIGTTTPSAQLTTTGSVRFASLGSAGANLITDVDGNVSVSSDERLKDIQDTFTTGLDAVLSIEPINYKWNEQSGMETEHTYTGFSAQNILASIPEAVAEDSRGFLTLSDRPILAAVVNAIKELYQKIVGIEETVETLQEENDELRARIEALEAEQNISPTYIPVPLTEAEEENLPVAPADTEDEESAEVPPETVPPEESDPSSDSEVAEEVDTSTPDTEVSE
jgi:hypothetical protein